MSIYLLAYYLVFLLVSGFDYKRFKTTITPYIILTLPLLLVITFVNTVGQKLGFFSISSRSIMLFNLFTFTFWFGGLPFHYNKLKTKLNNYNYKDRYSKYEDYYEWMIYIAVISSIVSLFLTWNGFSEFFNSEIENNYGRGFWGHLSIIGYPAFILLFPKLIKERNRRITFLFIIFSLLSLLYQSKTRLFFMILGGIIHYLIISGRIFNTKKVIKQFSYVFAIAITIFISIYLLTFVALMGRENVGSEQFSFIITDRFLNYAVGPVISCSENFELNNSFEKDNIQRLFSVPYNFYALLTGNEFISPIRSRFVAVSDSFSDNAGTLFIYPFEAFGITGTIIFMLFLGVISYYSFFNTLAKTNSALFFSIMMTSLFLGFFGYFYHLLFFYEILFWGYFIPPFFKAFHRSILTSIQKSE